MEQEGFKKLSANLESEEAKYVETILEKMPLCDVVLADDSFLMGLYYDEKTMKAPQAIFMYAGEMSKLLIKEAEELDILYPLKFVINIASGIKDDGFINEKHYTLIATIYTQFMKNYKREIAK